MKGDSGSQIIYTLVTDSSHQSASKINKHFPSPNKMYLYSHNKEHIVSAAVQQKVLMTYTTSYYKKTRGQEHDMSN